mgnify:CR=1 FL=1
MGVFNNRSQVPLLLLTTQTLHVLAPLTSLLRAQAAMVCMMHKHLA